MRLLPVRPDNVRNPLGYYCPPNGCGPDYVSEPSFNRFLAWGFLTCHEWLLGPGTESIAATEEDVWWLRANFLDAVNLAIEAAPHVVQYAYGGDQPESGITLDLTADDDRCRKEDIYARWEFEMVTADHDLVLVLRVADADVAGFLSRQAVSRRRKYLPSLVLARRLVDERLGLSHHDTA